MKKFLPCVLISLSILWSCSLFSKSEEHTFESDYKNAVEYAMDVDFTPPKFMKNFYDSWSPSGYDTSWIRLMFDIQNQASGSLFLSADAMRETYKKFSAKMAMSGSIELPVGQISRAESQGEFKIDSTTLKYYGKLDKLVVDGFLADSIPWIKTISSYLWKWYVFDYIESMSNILDRNTSQKMVSRILRSEIWLIIDFQNNGLDTMRGLLQSYPLFIPTGSWTVNWDIITYPVALSQTGIIDFTHAFLVQYSGSWLTGDEKQKMLTDLNDVSFHWDFSVALGNPAYSTLSGTIITQTGSWEPLSETVMMIFQKDITEVSILSQSGGLVSILNKGDDDNWKYTLDISEKEKPSRLIDVDYSSKKNDNHIKVVLTPPTESGWILEAHWNNDDFEKFSWYIGDVSKENYFEVSGRSEADALRSLSGKFVTQSELPNEIMNFNYVRDADDIYTGEIITPEVQLEFNWKAKKEDFLFETIVQWMSVKIENKKINKTDWKWLVSLPVAKMDWFIKNDNQILRELKANVTSPFVTAKVDMKPDSDWTRWTYIVSAQWQVLSTGKIGLMKKPKYFGIRLESILPELWSQLPSFFEFVGMTDIRWDKNVKIDFPKDAILFDMNTLLPNNISPETNQGNDAPDGSLWSYLERSRDVARISHLKDLSTTLGAYYADREEYPESEWWCFPIQGMTSYFYGDWKIPVDPVSSRLSWNCDGKNGTTYGYGTYKNTAGYEGFYLIAEMEESQSGNSSVLPEEITDETSFGELKRGAWKYYIIYR